MKNVCALGNIFIAIFLFSLAGVSTPAAAQINLSITPGSGAWVPILPDYRALSHVTTGGVTVVQPDLFKSEAIGLGAGIGLEGFLEVPSHTNWLVDFDLNLAQVDGLGSTQSFVDPGVGQTLWMPGLDGATFINTLNNATMNATLDSDVLFYNEYIGTRRKLQPLGGLNYLDFGGGFSHLAIEQEHALTVGLSTGESGNYIEHLDSTYLGGELRSTAGRMFLGRQIYVDSAFGMFWMNGDYDGTSQLFNSVGTLFNTATAAEQINRFAVSVDLAVKTQMQFGRLEVQPELFFKYISDVASINHPQTEIAFQPDPVSLTTEAGYFLGFNLNCNFSTRP